MEIEIYYTLAMDTLSPAERSERMSRVRGKHTKPELFVRKVVYEMGFRYRLHAKDLPGKPDLVFRSRRKVIFVHGCFWHRHHGCRLARLPKSRFEFWVPKLDANRKRDQRAKEALSDMGWNSITIWECELSDMSHIQGRVSSFLNKLEGQK